MVSASARSSRVAITPTIWQRDSAGSLTVLSAVISYSLPFFWGVRLFFSMLARKQELSTQVQQLIDSFLLAFALLLAHTLRVYSTVWFNLPYSIDRFANYSWVVIVVMLFGPILLDLQGFYHSPFDKTKRRSIAQIFRAMVYLGVIVSACVIFLRLPLASRSVPILFGVIAMVMLL